MKKAYSLIETRKKMAELDTTNTRNDQISDLVDRHAQNDQLDNLFSGPSKLSDSVFSALIMSMTSLILAISSQNDKKIDHFTDVMQSLAL